MSTSTPRNSWKGTAIRRLLRILSLTAAFALTATAALPWYYLPVLDWAVPAPPWNWSGFAVLVLAGCLVLRGLAGAWVRWLVRPALLFALYMWWNSLTEIRNWGIKTLGPLQMKLSPLNLALEQLGADGVEIFRAQAWKTLEPGWGWYAAGSLLALTALLTLTDRAFHDRCTGCGARTKEPDNFCHACGRAVSDRALCTACSGPLSPGDLHCRSCGRQA